MTGDSFGHLIFVTRISNEEQPNIWPNVDQHIKIPVIPIQKKADQNPASKDFWGSQNTVLVRAEPVLSGEWRCLLSIILQFSPRDCLGPRLAMGWPELNLWHWQSQVYGFYCQAIHWFESLSCKGLFLSNWIFWYLNGLPFPLVICDYSLTVKNPPIRCNFNIFPSQIAYIYFRLFIP